MAGRDPSHRDKVRRRKVEKMSYSEKDGQVVLTMSRDDYDLVLKVFAMATVRAMTDKVKLRERLERGRARKTSAA